MQPNSPTKRYVDKDELISRLRTEKKRYFYWNPQSEAIQNAIDILTLTDDVCEYSISKSVLEEYDTERKAAYETYKRGVMDRLVDPWRRGFEFPEPTEWLEGKIKR